MKFSKKLLGKIEVLIFTYPKHKGCRPVLGLLFAESWVSITGIQFGRLNVGHMKQEGKVYETKLIDIKDEAWKCDLT